MQRTVYHSVYHSEKVFMAGMNKLSDKKLKALEGALGDSVRLFADGAGLSAKVSKQGSISWVFTYRLGGRESKLERLVLGRYPDMSLRSARERRDQCRTWLADGRDPRRQLQESISQTLKPVTVQDALEYWIDNYAKHKRTDADAIRSQFATYIYPHIGNLALIESETRHWLQAFDSTGKKHAVTAGRLLQICKQALKFCRVRRFGTCDAIGMLTVNDVGKNPDRRDRVLSDVELADVWNSITRKDIMPYYRTITRLLVVFGCRTKELRVSQWSEWDFDSWVWTVPKEHSKTREKILRPIPPALHPWLTKLYECRESEYLLGELKTESAVSQIGRVIYKRFGHVEPWTFHDLRRSLSTHCADIGIPPHIPEMLLGHKLPAIMGNYNYGQYLPEKLDVLNKWIDRLEVLAGNHENVILLKAGEK